MVENTPGGRAGEHAVVAVDLAKKFFEIAVSEAPGRVARWHRRKQADSKRRAHFDFAFQPSLDRLQILDLAALTFIARKENVLLLGPPGVGKTHLAVALTVRACQSGNSVYFTTLDAMIRSLAAADRANKLDAKLRIYITKSQLLVIDEVGYLPLSRAEANYLGSVPTLVEKG